MRTLWLSRALALFALSLPLAFAVSACHSASPTSARLTLSRTSLRQGLAEAARARLRITCGDVEIASADFDFGGEKDAFELRLAPCALAHVTLDAFGGDDVWAYRGEAEVALVADETTEALLATFRYGEATITHDADCVVSVVDGSGDVVSASPTTFAAKVGSYIGQCRRDGSVVADAPFTLAFAKRITVALQPVSSGKGAILAPKSVEIVEGNSTSIEVTLDRAPTGPVDLRVNYAGDTRVQVQPATLSFGIDDWFVAHSVLLTMPNDTTVGGDGTGTITLAVVAAPDDVFADLSTTIPVTVTDDDRIELRVVAIGPLRTSESDDGTRTTTFSVSLGSIPTSTVSIELTSSLPTEATVSPSGLSFTPGNALVPQVVTVQGVNDPVQDGDQAYDIVFAVASSDADYAALSPTPFHLVNWDDEVPGLTSGFTVTPASPSANARPTVTGAFIPRGIVELYLDSCITGTPAGTTTASAAGVFSVDADLVPNTTNQVFVKGLSEHGYFSGDCGSFIYTHDDIAPSRMTFNLHTAPNSPSNATTFDVYGTGAEAFAYVDVYTDPTCSGPIANTSLSDAGGAFSVTITQTPDTTVSYRVRIRDQAGNRSQCSSTSVSYTHDSSALITSFGGVTPNDNPNATLNLATVVTSGGSFACFKTSDCSGAPFSTGSLDGAGNATCSDTIAGAEQTVTYTAQVFSGPLSQCSSPFIYYYDVDPPPPPSITGVSPGIGTLDLSWTTSIDASGSAVTYDVAACVSCTFDNLTTPLQTGLTTTSATLNSLGSCAQYDLAVRAVDVFGHQGAWVTSTGTTQGAAPTNLRAIPGPGHVELVWDATPSASGYDIETRDFLGSLIQQPPTQVGTSHYFGFLSAGERGDTTYSVKAKYGACSSAPAQIIQNSFGGFLPTMSYQPSSGTTQMGAAVVGLRDVTGDNIDDYAVGLPSKNGQGGVEVYSGRDHTLFRVLYGSPLDGNFGFALAEIPDVTNDGKPELAIGAPFVNAGSNAGAVYLFDVASGVALWRTTGSGSEQLGYSVSRAPDSGDDDGRDDVAAGAPHAVVLSHVDAGRVLIFSSANGLLSATLNANAAASNLQGTALAASGDGTLNLYVGAPGAAGGDGQVYVYTGPIFSLTDTVLAPVGSQEGMGTTLAVVGDTQGVGYGTLVTGGPNYVNGADNGVVRAYDPVATSFIGSLFGTASAVIGASIAAAGDWDHDGAADVWVASPAAFGGAGEISLYAVAGGGFAKIAYISGPGISSSSFGFALGGARDFDGDGFADLAVGAPTRASNNGGLFLFGTNFDVLRPLQGGFVDVLGPGGFDAQPVQARALTSRAITPLPGVGVAPFSYGVPFGTSGSGVNAAGGFYFPGTDFVSTVDTVRITDDIGRQIDVRFTPQLTTGSFAFSGGYATNAGTDLIVRSSGGIGSNVGLSTFLMGAPGYAVGGVGGSVSLRDSTGAEVAAVYGAPGDKLGASVAAIADVDSDGVGDIVVGSPNGAGYVKVLSGAGLSELTTYTGVGTDGFGTQVVGLPDIDADGLGDFAISAPGANSNQGVIYIYSGNLGGSPICSFSGISGQFLGKAMAYVGGLDPLSDSLFIAASKVSGLSGAVVALNLTTCLSTPYWTNTGAAFSQFGAAIAGGYDFDADGVPDVVVGAPGQGGGAGRIDIINGLLGLSVAHQDGAAVDHYGTAIALPGDTDGDGVFEIAVGAPDAGTGRVDLIQCVQQNCGNGVFSLTYFNNDAGVGGKYGADLATIGDWNFDGNADFAAVNPGYDGGSADEGRIVIMSVQAPTLHPRPTNFTVTDIGGGQVTVQCDNMLIGNYRWEYRTLGGQWLAQDVNAFSTIIGGLAANEEYVFRVSTTDGQSQSAYSIERHLIVSP